MRTRLKILAAILGALTLLATACIPGLNASNYVLKSELPEVVPPLACPKEGSLFKLRAYNIATADFYEALRILNQNAPGALDTFERTMLDLVQFDGRLLSVLELVFAGELRTGYFAGLLEQRRLEALIDVLRPCPESPFLRDTGEIAPSELYPQTGARLQQSSPYFIPVTFDFSRMN